MMWALRNIKFPDCSEMPLFSNMGDDLFDDGCETNGDYCEYCARKFLVQELNKKGISMDENDIRLKEMVDDYR